VAAAPLPVSFTATPARCATAPSHVLLSTGLRREELVAVDLDQLSPSTPDALRAAKRAKISDARGTGRTSRHVFLSAASIGSRRHDGLLSPRSINAICELNSSRDGDGDRRAPAIHTQRPSGSRHAAPSSRPSAGQREVARNCSFRR